MFFSYNPIKHKIKYELYNIFHPIMANRITTKVWSGLSGSNATGTEKLSSETTSSEGSCYGR